MDAGGSSIWRVLADNEDSQQRQEGYRGHWLPTGSPLTHLWSSRPNFNSTMAQSAVSDLILNDVKFDAIFAADDEAAAGAMMALRRAGRPVPDDVSVVGFDDVQFSE